MADGGTYAGLRQRYTTALGAGENSLRALLGASSSSWKPVQTVIPGVQAARDDGSSLSRTEGGEDAATGIAVAGASAILVHRKKVKDAPHVFRAVCTVPISDPCNALESFRAVLGTDTLRPSWDPAVEKQEVLEVVEPGIKLSRTYTKIGWPSNARDFVTIDKTLHEPGKTLINIAVSLPRSSAKGSNDPPFLQPSPPYVRSHVHLCAFVITCPTPTRAKISMYWQWDLKGSSVVWTTHVTTMPKTLAGLVENGRQQSSRLPYLRSWGKGVTVDSETFDTAQDRLDISYGIFTEDSTEEHDRNAVLLEKSKERRRLERAVELKIPSIEGAQAGWDITVRQPKSDDNAHPHWQAAVERTKAMTDRSARLTLRISYTRSSDDFTPMQVSLQRMAGSKFFRVNGNVLTIVDLEERNPAAFVEVPSSRATSNEVTRDTASVLVPPSDLDTASHVSHITTASHHTAKHAAEWDHYKDLTSHIGRSYAHFLALLQSPGAKWKQLGETRKVAISSYIAIDPAMAPIYRYETTLDNTTIWDIFSIFTNDGMRLLWDKASGLEKFQFLDEIDVHESAAGGEKPDSATEGRVSFWDARWKAIWPATPREAVFARTAYRSSSSVHIMQTSVPDDDDALLLRLRKHTTPSAEGALKLDSRLQSMALDQISPTSVSLILVDQTSPKGWTKSGYANMANAMANIGELGRRTPFSACIVLILHIAALKEGAPPLVSGLMGAVLASSTYDHTKSGAANFTYKLTSSQSRAKGCECTLRLDTEIWSPSGVSLTVNPPPARTSAMLRHRLSASGSGYWITIEHEGPDDLETIADLVISIQIQKRNDSAISEASEPRAVVTINGVQLQPTVEELKEAEIQELRLRRRMKSRAIMLDQGGTVRNSAHFGRPPSIMELEGNNIDAQINNSIAARPATPALPVREVVKKTSSSQLQPSSVPSVPADSGPSAMALRALANLRRLHSGSADKGASEDAEWTILSYTENNAPIRISKRFLQDLSPDLPLYRVERTFRNVPREQLLQLLQTTSSSGRTSWDERLQSSEMIAYYGNGLTTATWIAKPSFPTRARLAHVATLRADQISSEGTKDGIITFLATCSISSAVLESDIQLERPVISVDSLNPSAFYEGQMPLEGWVIETAPPANDIKDDDVDNEEAQADFYTKCSFYTCSDLPLMVPGTFGNASLRTRLARMFDLLETLSKLKLSEISIQWPAPALQIGKGWVSPQEGSSWSISPLASSNVSVLACHPTSIIFSVTIPDEARTDPLSNASRPPSISSHKDVLARGAVPSRLMNGDGHTGSPLSETRRGITLTELVVSRDELTTAYDFKIVTASLDSKLPIAPTDTSFWHILADIPVQTVVYPTTLPIKPTTSYTIRFFLSTRTSPTAHPLSDTAHPIQSPKWRRRLAEGAIVQIQAFPSKTTGRTEGKPLAPLRFSLNGKSVPVLNSEQTRQLLASEPERPLVNESSHIEQRRAQYFESLAYPRLVNTAFLKHPPSRRKSYDKSLQSPELASTPATGKPGENSDDPPQPKDVTIVLEKAKQPIMELFTATTVVQHGPEGAPGSRRTSHRTYRLSLLVLVAVTAFLCGFLARSLFSPGDYIFFSRSLSSVEAAVWELMNPEKKWKVATRLLQLPIPGLGQDFVAALVERE